MADRVASIVVLAEDIEQARLVERYVKRGIDQRQNIRRSELCGGRGSGEAFVRRQYAKEVAECRRQAARTRALLIVVIDADVKTVEERAGQLEAALSEAGQRRREDSDPVVVLIPKRSIETWVYCLLGGVVDETRDYSARKPSGNQIRLAAHTLFDWSRPNATPPDTCVPSLRTSFPEWRRIA